MEVLMAAVKAVETLVGAHPHPTVPVAKQGGNNVGLKRGWVGIAVQEDLEAIAVETVKPIVGCHPNGTHTVLTQAADKAAGKKVGGKEMATLRIGTHHDEQTGYNRQ